MNAEAQNPALRTPPTRLQAALHSFLRAHSGRTFSREELCAAVWQMNHFHSSRTIDQTVSVVRKHLAEGEKIVTVFGIGYRHEGQPHGRPRNLDGRRAMESSNTVPQTLACAN